MAYIKIEPNTDFYGTGEVTGDLLRNGTNRTLWNTDNWRYMKERGQRLYQSHPWVLAVREDGSPQAVLEGNMNVEVKNVRITIIMDEGTKTGEYKFSDGIISVKI